jgi:amyloid beta precursor protein binding protein 1
MGPLSLLPIYLALRATSHVDASVSAESTITSEQILTQVGRLAKGAEANERVVEASREVARAGGGELHNVSALTGGMVAQEVIKIITKQYVPIDNTCVFDGIGSRCQVLRL